MKKLYVNSILETNNATHGITAENDLVLKNIKLLYGETKASLILNVAKTTKEFYLIEKACQFVCLIQKDSLGFTMKLTDFKENLDSSLDEYLELEKLDWKKSDLNKIIKIAQEIRNDKNLEKAELVKDGFNFD